MCMAVEMHYLISFVSAHSVNDVGTLFARISLRNGSFLLSNSVGCFKLGKKKNEFKSLRHKGMKIYDK